MYVKIETGKWELLNNEVSSLRSFDGSSHGVVNWFDISLCRLNACVPEKALNCNEIAVGAVCFCCKSMTQRVHCPALRKTASAEF